MKNILNSSNLYSHPDKFLETHLINVANLADLFINNIPLENKDILKNVIRIIALSHDIGKATNFFQNYLKNDETERNKTQHSLFGAVCGYFLVKEYFSIINKDSYYFPFLAYVLIKRHHGDLNDINYENVDEKSIKLLKEQLESINNEKLNILSQHLYNAGLPLKINKEILLTWIHNIDDEFLQVKRFLRKNTLKTIDYFIFNLLYSILLDADKSDVVIEEKSIFEQEHISIPVEIIDKWKINKNFQKSFINDLREKAFNDVKSIVIDINTKVYTLNLPTGLGKTITSLYFALKLREEIKNITKSTPRIIYSLPFLSIIDQNVQVFENVLKTEFSNIETNLLLKHHHLSEIYYTCENVEYEPDEAKILIEGWNSEIIVTTFVQLFHTLISNRNKSLRKFHRIANSIIILDEIQAIPIKYWNLMRDVFRVLTDQFNVRIIFVTATNPLIFTPKDTFALVNLEEYFYKLNRVIIKTDMQKKTIEQLIEEFKFTDDKRYLFILNTIDSAKKVYALLKNDFPQATFLSTHITPKERLQRIEKMRNKEVNLAVTTQLVEAGVDIDFDIVVRDFAPLDSINQSAGRCNRNGTNNSGTVFVVNLINDKGKRYSCFVYDLILLDITEKNLKDYKEIEESKFLELINGYYSEASNKKVQNADITNAIKNLIYDSPDSQIIDIASFKLIDNDIPKKDCFVEIDEKAAELWIKYNELKNIKNIFDRRKEFDKIKSEFYQYVISIPDTKLQKNLPPRLRLNDFFYISYSQLKEHYDLETGFKAEAETSVW